jgi:Holliday junction resolvasome RuvABC endonuclease subunit
MWLDGLEGGKGSAWERTAQIAETIKEMIIEDSLQNYHIVIEQPINVRNKKTAITLANCNGMLLGMLQAVIDGFTFIPNSSWASFHLISGKRTERKEQSKAILLHDLGLDGLESY